LKVSGKSGGWMEDPPEEMQHPEEEGEEEEEEKEEPMAMARLHGSGWDGRFQKALDGKEREARDGWAGWMLACWAWVADYIGAPLCESDGLDGPI
jgi:hypothetical protein